MRRTFVPGLFVAAVLAALAACAPVAPAPRPSDGTIYDARGNPIYVPNPRMPDRTPTETGSFPEEESRPGEPVPERPEPTPPPRIGAGPGTGDDGYLIAAVSPLTRQARDQMDRGEYDRALSTAERAIRIDGTNPELWQLMAHIQLKREEFGQAEQLARKSNLLAGNNDSLRAENWTIIADSYSGRGERSRAEEARKTARRLERR